MSDTFDHFFDALDQDYEGADEPRKYRGGEICRYCHASGLHWRELVEGWRLVERVQPGNFNAVHECRVTAASPDEFV